MPLLPPTDQRRHALHGGDQRLVVGPQLENSAFNLGEKMFNRLVRRQQLPVEGGVVHLGRLQPT
jgi:hypothetical protein